MIITESAQRLSDTQFSRAISRNNRWMHVWAADDYAFSGAMRQEGVTGLGALTLLNDMDSVTIVDIGAGFGTFLDEAQQLHEEAHGLNSCRAIGLTATRGRHTDNPRIEWVYGDMQQPASTWQPDTGVALETVDLAVSNLAFMHLSNPLAGIRNSLQTLKPGGHLLTDRMDVYVHPDTPEVAEAIVEELQLFAGSTGIDYRASTQDKRLDHPAIQIFSLHLQGAGKDKLPFESLVADTDSNDTIVVYSAA